MQTTKTPRILGLDIGSRRTGVAVTDELGAFAHARPAILHRSNRELVSAVKEIVGAEGVSEVVVGLPIGMSGGETAQTMDVRDVVRMLREQLQIPVTEWDERLSSREASRTVKGERNRKTGVLDSAAAAIVLQAVLDSRRPATP